MSFFKSWFGPAFVPRVIEHPELGKIKNDRTGAWNGILKECPGARRSVRFSVTAEDFTDDTATFLIRIRDHFGEALTAIRQGMLDDLRDLPDFANGTTMSQLVDGLRFEFFSVWSVEKREWQLFAEETPLFRDGLFRVQMVDLEYKGFCMDT